MILKEFYEDYFELYIKEETIMEIDICSKTALELFIKSIMLELKKNYEIVLNGIYSLKIYISCGHGAFIVANRIDSLFSKNTVDFRAEIISNCNFYYMTDDYFLVKDSKKIYTYDGNYYVEIDELKNNIDFCELGEIVFNEFLKIKSKCLKI